jgi:glycosyltransferase involved in cell wall biosynthesis
VHSYGWITYSCLAAVRDLDVAFVVSTRDYGNFCAVRTFVHKGSLCSGPAPLKCVGCAKDFYGAAKGAVATTSVLAGRRRLTSRIDGLHFNSTFVGETMKRHLLRLDAHAPVPVPSAVMPTFRDDSADGPPDRDVLARLPSVPFILFVGALRRVKGVHLLLDAYRRLEGAPPLVLMGTREIDSPDAFPKGVSVMESIPHGTVMAAWDRAMFGVFPSLWAEPLGNVVHEAMSRGRPVIGTRPGGHVDMIAEGETGLTVPSGDEDALVAAMQRMVDDGPLRERMGRAAEIRARLFTAEHAMPLMERLYAEAVEHRLKRRDG